jgi:hypothetical protein
MRYARVISVALSGGALALLVAPRSSAEEMPCPADVEYDLNATLALTETPMGAGDGSYTIGPGKVVLSFDNGRVQMLSYAMRENFTIHAHTVFWTTTVKTETKTAGTPDACSVVAEGTFDRATRTLRWRTPLRGYHTDGTLVCSGSMCGKFGAPPTGESQLHIGPGPVAFSPFVFSPDLKTFTMASTHVAKTSMPKQSAAVALAGREVRRTCAQPRACQRTRADAW